MSKEECRRTLDQVTLKYDEAYMAYESGEYEEADNIMAEMRDVLDDIYDRPEEDV